jgi:hypothetical protein
MVIELINLYSVYGSEFLLLNGALKSPGEFFNFSDWDSSRCK